VPVDAELLFGLRQHARPFFEPGTAVRDALLVHQHREIVPDRLLELRLVVHRIEDALVGLNAGQRLVEGLRPDAADRRRCAQIADAGSEIGSGGRGGHEAERCRKERASDAGEGFPG
jgi:hypothetical protein